MTTLIRLGFLPNWERSQLTPTQYFHYVGARFRLDLGLVFPPQERIEYLRQMFASLENSSQIEVRLILQILGVMNSCIELVPWARLHMRPIQLYLLHFWRRYKGDVCPNSSNEHFNRFARLVEGRPKYVQGEVSGDSECSIGFNNRCIIRRLRGFRK